MIALLLAGRMLLPAAADASEACAAMFDRFADELDRIAASYDRMKTDREVCAFGRDTDIPTRRKILGEVEANRGKCASGPAALNMARTQLEKAISETEVVCRRAGM
jgi:hypothetical protein